MNTRHLFALLLCCALPLRADFISEQMKESARTVEASLKRRGLPPRENFDAVLEFTARDSQDTPAVQTQVQEVVRFAAQLYIDAATHGVAFPLDEIEILPVEQTARKKLLTLRGTKLVVGLSPTPIFQDHLREAWDKGEHLASDSPLRRYWYYLNPVGELRTLLRSELLDSRRRLVEELTEFGIPGNARAIAKGRELIQKFLPGAASKPAVKEWDEGKVLKVLAAWKEHVQQESLLSNLVKAVALRAQSISAHSQADVDVELEGAVAYGNHHRIDIRLTTKTPWEGYFQVTPQPRKLKVRAKGTLFAGFTIDDISVDVNLDGALEAIALAKALE